MSNSHEWAKQLRDTAEFLESRPAIDMDGEFDLRVYFFSGGKEPFLAAVRALKPGAKEMDNHYVRFNPTGTRISLVVDRNLVCRKVQDIKWECEPLLSPEEEAELETREVPADDIPF